jgi:hypothetical protein
MESCLYEGYLQHRRLSPTEHIFRYTLYLVYLDLDEVPTVLGGGYGLHRATFSPASFLCRDHAGDACVPLADGVRNLAEEGTGWRPAGPIRLLTLLRNWGHYFFCPLSLYYCFDSAGQTVDAVVAEVTNTPWQARHWYVLWQGNRIDPRVAFLELAGVAALCAQFVQESAEALQFVSRAGLTFDFLGLNLCCGLGGGNGVSLNSVFVQMFVCKQQRRPGTLQVPLAHLLCTRLNLSGPSWDAYSGDVCHSDEKPAQIVLLHRLQRKATGAHWEASDHDWRLLRRG